MRMFTTIVVASLALSAVAHAQSTPPASSEARFVTINDNALLSSGLLGLDVRNPGGERLGKIEDIVFEGGQLVGIILAMGDAPQNTARYVAIDPSSISVTYVAADERWRATVNAQLDQLKTAPEFRYEGKWKR
jgi:hypothetical protein